MKQSMNVPRRQLAFWLERDDPVQPSEELREELTSALADLLLEALGVKAVANQHSGGGDESEDHA
ncbi:MAG TPA: hypothetical protein VFP68_01105 [Burkholderiaceae bacterium]|nr:hypothetical protein [Burkholderiaceae bacterium]